VNLTDIQQYVWAQTDTTDVDLTGATIENYVNEAFIRTIGAENCWPFYEQNWLIPKRQGDAWLEMPIDMNPPAIMSVYALDGGPKLQQINQEEAEDRFTHTASSGGAGGYYSIWANRLWLWPLTVSDLPRDFVVRGYRRPLVTFDPATGEVDADPRLHRALAHYAVALAYAQQEDDVLEGRYMERWQQDVTMARRAIMDPAGHRPLVMNGNFNQRRGVPPVRVGGVGFI